MYLNRLPSSHVVLLIKTIFLYFFAKIKSVKPYVTEVSISKLEVASDE